MEELELILESASEQMQLALDHLEKSFTKIRAGRPSASMLQGVMVEYYGASTPLNQVANISVPDAMTLSIQPFEKSLISGIEKAIINSNLGFAPNNNGEYVIISVPPLTEERRKELTKQAKSETENAKVSIRNARKDANNDIKKVEGVSEDIIKDYEEKNQQLTDSFIVKVEQHFAKKEAEIMKV
ncbi:MAG: ribosome recycling factor [Flavobacteriales bacterium]|nr:ribosome recycling factor [Flavobacteriales bacterium]